MSEEFARLVATKMQQQIQEAEEHGRLSSYVLQQTEEQEYYKYLDGTNDLIPEKLSVYDEKSITPRIQEKGMSKKSRNKLRKRTLKNYNAGLGVVGGLATVQTVPLKMSMSKNAETVEKKAEQTMDATRALEKMSSLKQDDKKRLKLQEQEKKNIEELSKLEIPRDIFDVEITKKHSHFDVKKAMLIRKKLQIIEDYKNEHSMEYEFLDFDVYVRLEMLLDKKAMFEQTMKTVLSANGLTIEGDVEEKGEIKEARKAYKATKDAYRETLDSYPTFEQKKAALLEKCRKEQRIGADFLDERTAAREEVIINWKKLRESDPDKADVPEELPKAFLDHQFYSRCSYSLIPGKLQENYERVKMNLFAAMLPQQAQQKKELDKDPAVKEKNERILAKLKSMVVPLYQGYIDSAEEMAEKIQQGNFRTNLAHYKELYEYEMMFQNLGDLMKVIDTDGEKTIKDNLGMSKEEVERFRRSTNYLSYLRQVYDSALTEKAMKAGIEVKGADLSANLRTGLNNVGVGLTKDTLQEKLDPKTCLPEFTKKKDQAIDRIRIYTIGPEYRKTEGEVNERRAEIDHQEAIARQMKKEIEEEMNPQAELMEKAGEIMAKNMAGESSEGEGPVKRTVDLTNLRQLFFATGVLQKSTVIGDKPLTGEQLSNEQEKSFRQMIRELFHSVEEEKFVPKEGKTEVELKEGVVTFEAVEKLFAHFDEEHIMEFMKPFLEFNLKGFLDSLDKEALSNPIARADMVTKRLEKIHYLTNFSQWAETFKIRERVSAENWKKISDQMGVYTLASSYATTLAAPGVLTKTTFLEYELPQVENVLECKRRSEELKAVNASAKEKYVQTHPLTQFTVDELKKTKVNGFDSEFLGKAYYENGIVSIPVSKDELKKIVQSDAMFIKELAVKVSEFSMADQNLRRRVLIDDTAKDLIQHGEEDLLYYTEMNRYAKMLRMANEVNPEAVQKILGGDTEKLLKECDQIKAILLSLRFKFDATEQFAIIARNTIEEQSGDTLEHIKSMREDHVMARMDEKAKKYMKPVA